MTISLNGSDLTVTQVMAVARHGEAVALAPEAVGAMRRARAVVEDVLAGGEPVYGLTTGVGERKAFLLDPAERRQFGAGTGRAYRMIRELVPFTQADGTFPADLEPVVDLVTRVISPQPLDPPRPAVTMTACSPCESVKAPSVTAPATAPVPARARRTSPSGPPEPGTSRPAFSSPAREISAVRPGQLRRPLAPRSCPAGPRGLSDHLLSPPARRSPFHVSA